MAPCDFRAIDRHESIEHWLTRKGGVDLQTALDARFGMEDFLQESPDARQALIAEGGRGARLERRRQARIDRELQRRINRRIRERVGLLGWLKLLWQVGRLAQLLIGLTQFWPLWLLSDGTLSADIEHRDGRW